MPLSIALASSCCIIAALETPDACTTARMTHRPKTKLPGVMPVVFGATTVLVAMVKVEEALRLVVTVVAVAVVKLVHVDAEVTINGMVVVKVNVSVVVMVTVSQISVRITLTGTPASPFRTTTSAFVLPFKFTRLF